MGSIRVNRDYKQVHQKVKKIMNRAELIRFYKWLCEKRIIDPAYRKDAETSVNKFISDIKEPDYIDPFCE